MALYLSILLLTVFISEGKCGCLPDLQNLRTFTVTGYGGYFSITEDDFHKVINNRVHESGWPSVNIQPRNSSNPEVSIYLSNVKDMTLKEDCYEPNDYLEVGITLLVKVGAAGNATEGDLQLGHFTKTEDTLNPYLVNYGRTVVLKQLDIIEEANSVTWSMKNDSGELEIKVEWTGTPQDLQHALRKRRADGSYTVKTDFPQTLDWGCDEISKPSFCSVLSANSSEIQEAGAHISNINVAQYYNNGDDDATYVMEITKITGEFKELLPFLQESQKSVFALHGSSHETVGIAYDCINEE